MKKKCLISFMLIITMMFNLLPITVLAADGRTEISNVKVTTDMALPTYGAEVKGNHSYNTYTYTITQGAPAIISTTMGEWYKKEDGEWRSYTAASFTEGTYQFGNQVRIDGSGANNYKFSNSLKVQVDGVPWGVSYIENYDDYCMAYISSPEYNVVRTSIPLVFNYSESFDIEENTVNTPIKSYSVASGVIGGTGSYTFRKISGPSWVNVSSTGTVTGTPTMVGTNSDLVIRVTDQASNYKEITINVGKTFKNPVDRTPILTASATSTMSKPVYGMPVETSYTYSYEENSPIRFTNTMSHWCKYNGSEWEEYTEATFGTGRYYYSDQIRIDGAAGREYVFGDSFILNVNGEDWICGTAETRDTYSYLYAQSPMYEVLDSTPTYTATVLTNEANCKVEYSGVQYPSGKTFYFKQGEEVLLYAKAGEGYEFDEAESSDVTLENGGSICRYFTMPSKDVTVTFNFNEIKDQYEVEFETGEGSSVPSQLVDKGGYATEPEKPTRSHNWNFYGWLEDPTDYWNNFNFTNTPINKDTTLYAQWGFYAYVSNNPNKGMVTLTDSLADPPEFSEGSGFNGIIYEGRPWYVYAQAKEGYKFKHWKNTTTNEIYSTNNPVCFNNPLGTDSIIEAIYEEDENAIFTVSFDTKGGSAEDSQLINKGSCATRPLTNPIRDGFEFVDWYADNACTTLFDFDTPIVDTTTVYAKWTPTTAQSYTITFDSRGGSTVPNQVVYEGDKVIRPTNPTKGNWMVTDWLTDSNNPDSSFNFNTVIPNKNMTLYAKWGFYCYIENDKSKGKVGFGESASEEPSDYGTGEGFNGYIFEGGSPWIVWAKPNNEYEFKYWIDYDTNQVYSTNRAIQISSPLNATSTRIQAVYEKKLPFTDIDYTRWYVPYVRYAYENGLMSGYTGADAGKFGPNDTINRAQIVTILYRHAGKPSTDYEMNFSDIPTSDSGSYYYDAVKWAAANGIVTGYASGEYKGQFRPRDPITREQLAVILQRYAAYCGKDSTSTQDISEFSDSNQVSGYAVNAMRWAVAVGIIKGNADGTLKPKGTATRAEAAAMIMRFIEEVN